MPSYAVTYPQLLEQAQVLGADASTLHRLHRTYATAQCLLDGFYRPGDQPFLCHVVRTASILLAERQATPVVNAALVHAAYQLHRYDGSSRAAPTPRRRAELRERIGADVEAIVWEYARLDWFGPYNRGEIRRHAHELPDYTPTQRAVLTIRVADELENHLDLGATYRSSYPLRERIEANEQGMIELARALELPGVADELPVRYREALSAGAPPIPVVRRRPYELPARRMWRASASARLYAFALRSVGRPVGRLLRRGVAGRASR